MSEFREIRRKRQQLSEEESIGILQKATAGTIGFGRMHIMEDEAERLQMARMLGNGYNRNDDESLKKEIESGLSRMLMMRFDIEHLTGKEAIELVKQRLLESDNFVKLVKEGYYDGRLFDRVIKDLMIQGGDPDWKGARAGKMLGVGGADYTLEAEMKEGLFDKRGALAAAGEGDEVNAERRSSGSQFYIVWGQVYNGGQLRQF